MKEQVKQAIRDLEDAKMHWRFAEPDFVEAAIHEVKFRECRLNSLLKLAKGG